MNRRIEITADLLAYEQRIYEKMKEILRACSAATKENVRGIRYRDLAREFEIGKLNSNLENTDGTIGYVVLSAKKYIKEKWYRTGEWFPPIARWILPTQMGLEFMENGDKTSLRAPEYRDA